ncbi:ATP-binding cassette domain-containing protein [Flaviaesturariibacter amylovorans]|uniref:ATP-binding cassette domain-containing protein n=1 Tax=Flaviaesturariibacter amylovorans TaxID=1084520 RepID=A0ABP8HVI9_9BACT
MTHHLEADSIRLQFGDRTVLSGAWLKCSTGGITGLLGRNGQGKSCLLKIIHGSLDAEKSVRIDGSAQFAAFRRPDLLQYGPQFHFVPGHLSVARVLDDFGLPYAAFAERFPEFAGRERHRVRQLSGGERRLLELYGLVMSPSLFALLDEPFTHLNPLQIEKVKELLVERKAHKGFLVTDHLYRHVIDICDPLYLLVDGRTHLVKQLEDIETMGYARL